MNESPPPATVDETPAADEGKGGADGAGAKRYQVLARKYRPTTFAGLIGQEAMVRTLTNAFKANRIAHAFILTGVRGIGKTSTARIIARALNCTGPDGTGGPTTEPCGVCDNCRAIAEDRHVDVLEMDAASRTGVDDIRELIEGVRYRPTAARYKVYIIDEVHMLSRNAFNALLKTLEEPPEHVKFVFATTEIRKVPVTVLSRCQRFDLRRLDAARLAEHFQWVCDQEGAEIEPAALELVARAADGSVRDGLSLLDQAISQASGPVSEAQVRDMLGLADRGQSFQLLEAAFRGETAQALELMAQLYRDGADPAAVVEDLLEVVHWLTRIKVVPSAADAPEVPEIERELGRKLAENLGMPDLSRAWQILLKGLSEIRQAPSPLKAAEMLLVRLVYTADLPTPEEALKQLASGAAASPAAGPAAPGGGGSAPTGARASGRSGGGEPARAVAAETAADADAAPRAFRALEEIAELAGERREQRLRHFLEHDVRLVRLEPGRIEIALSESADGGMIPTLRAFLNAEAGNGWAVSIAGQSDTPTIAERRTAERDAEVAEAAAHPLVKAVFEAFPGAKIETIRRLDAELGDPADPSLAGDDDGDSPTDPDQ